MPIYATEADAVALYGEEYIVTSADRDDDGRIDDAFADAVTKAQSELDSYLGIKYDLPLPEVPTVLIRFTVDIAVYIASMTAGTLTDEKTERYKMAIKWAMNVAAGKASLGLDEEPATTGGGVTVSGPARIMTRSSLRRVF